MKFKKCLEIGIDCGLETAGECVRNIYIHASNFFPYSEIQKEIDELYTEANELTPKSGFTADDKAQDILGWINWEDDGIETSELNL